MNPTDTPTGPKPPGAPSDFRTSNLRIRSLEPLVPPARLMGTLPLDAAAAETIVSGRRAVEGVLSGRDPRLLAVVGPCSIHDVDAARDYAGRLRELSERVGDQIGRAHV